MSEIRIPFRDRNDHLSTVADSARTLSTDEDRAVARQLVLDGSASGLTTVGQLLDRLEAASPTERRTMLDDARAAAGLPTATALASKDRHREQDRLLSVAAADDVELRLTPGPAGWIDPDPVAVEAAQAHAEQERRALMHAQRRAARTAQLPELEIEEAAEREAWIAANVMRPQETP